MVQWSKEIEHDMVTSQRLPSPSLNQKERILGISLD